MIFDRVLLKFITAGVINTVVGSCVMFVMCYVIGKYSVQIDYLCTFSKKWLKNETIKILGWGFGKGHVPYWLKKRSEAR